MHADIVPAHRASQSLNLLHPRRRKRQVRQARGYAVVKHPPGTISVPLGDG